MANVDEQTDLVSNVVFGLLMALDKHYTEDVIINGLDRAVDNYYFLIDSLER